VPPVPDGTPAELFAYIERLADAAAPATSRGRQRYHLRKLNAAAAEAAARIMAQTRPGQPDHTAAVTIRFRALETLEKMEEPGAEAALAEFAASLVDSPDAEVRRMAEGPAGVARRLALPGNPMTIRGTLLSGKPFDQRTLEGKVVLVDFWATWCGPCVAEIPNLQAEYAKWHDKGFEVVGVSLDEDRDSLEAFVDAKKIPWPVLYEEPGGPDWQHPLATYYGITGIPTVVLIGADGNVITLDARGKKLGAALERLLGDPPDRIGSRPR
jgi:thiol-disulfide isomerase/thioredoxin